MIEALQVVARFVYFICPGFPAAVLLHLVLLGHLLLLL
jgi:hypothetical protein